MSDRFCSSCLVLMALLLTTAGSVLKAHAETVEPSITVVCVREADARNLSLEADQLASRYLDAYREVSALLGVTSNLQFQVILHDGSFTRSGVVYKTGGFTDSASRTIEMNAMVDSHGDVLIDKHELVHMLLESTFGRSRSRLLAEGFAVWVEDELDLKSYGGRSIDESLKEILRTPLFDLIRDRGVIAEGTFYPQAGDFVRWLVRTYGPQFALDFYRISTEPDFGSKKIREGLGVDFQIIAARYDRDAY